MATKTIDAVYERGVRRLRLGQALPFRDRAHLKLVITIPTNPVSRTRGIIRVAPRTARAIIYGDEADFFSA